MGFDVVYLTPIHPIGTTARKGRNNTLDRRSPTTPARPYAIGSPDGGHDAIHPDLGTFDDFDSFVAEAGGSGSRSPSTSPCSARPTTRRSRATPSGSPRGPTAPSPTRRTRRRSTRTSTRSTSTTTPPGAYAEMRRMIQVWIDHGVKIFRVDNPHTKPVEFWQWLIADVAKRAPRRHLARRGVHPAGHDAHAGQGRLPAVLHLLRLAQLALGAGGVLPRSSPATRRPTCGRRSGRRPTTSSRRTCSSADPTAWKLRAALAATLVPTYGIYAGYELIEHVARPGAEEQIDNEKYEYKDRRWADYEPGGRKEGQSLAPYLTSSTDPQARTPRCAGCATCASTTSTTRTSSCFSKTPPRRRRRATPSSSWPTSTRTAPERRWCTWTCRRSAWTGRQHFAAHDLITDQIWHWREHNYVRLGPDFEPVHVLEVGSH